MMKKFKILSIDGGGLRGVVPLTILKEVEKITGKRLYQCFDMVAGTSTGGLIACACMLKDKNNPVQPQYTLDDILNVYLNRGHEIFPEPNLIGHLWGSISDKWHPQFTADGIKKVFTDVLKDAKLSDSLIHLLISCYDLTNNQPLFFKTRLARQNPLQNALMYDVCRATSAGPTYLPAYEFNYPNKQELPDRLCIDGGVFINNPAMGAIAELSKHLPDYIPSIPQGVDMDYQDVFVLSVGTGSYKGKVSGTDAINKGELFWIKPLINIMMRGVNQTTDYEMTEMMEKGNYLRLNINIEEQYSDMTLSNPATSHYLIQETNSQVLNNITLMSKLRTLLNNMGCI